MIVIAALVWIVLVLVLGAGVTFAVLAFLRADRLMTWLATGSLGVALVLAWFSDGSAIPPVIAGLIVLAGMGLAVFGGGPVAVLALQLATRGSVRDGVHGGIVVADATTADGEVATAHEVLRGGTTIGVLERFAVAAAIIAGFPEALAIVVAIKGVGRFTELAAAEARERFIIGTLASLIWACLAAAIVRLALG